MVKHLFHIAGTQFLISRSQVLAKRVQLLRGYLDRVVATGKTGAHVADEISRDGGRQFSRLRLD